MQLIATCAFGLEKLVNNELKNLGFLVDKTEDGRVTFFGNESAIVKANLWLSCADRVQIKMGKGDALTFDQLFDKITALEWEKYIGPADEFPVKATSVKSALHSEPAIQSIVKKAVAKRLLTKHSATGLPENSGSVFQIMVKLNKDKFIVGIDSTGDSLHKRGYRTKATLAPMKETLAAALIQLSDWQSSGGETFRSMRPDGAKCFRTIIDPFCGSGTIAIEAAMMAANRAPGLTRPFAFQNWKWFDKKNLSEEYLRANEALKKNKPAKILGFDIDSEAIEIAKENAKNAGVGESAGAQGGIKFACADFRNLDFSSFENCTFITNPPYGERLEDKAKVEEMYREFGRKFAATKNCSLFLLTSNENFPNLFGRPADKNRKLFNGQIRCYLFSYGGFYGR